MVDLAMVQSLARRDDIAEPTSAYTHDDDHIQTIYRGLLEDTDRNQLICATLLPPWPPAGTG